MTDPWSNIKKKIIGYIETIISRSWRRNVLRFPHALLVIHSPNRIVK